MGAVEGSTINKFDTLLFKVFVAKPFEAFSLMVADLT
jgi:hypothetical protein